MEEAALTKLSEDQKAELSDELKAVFCMLKEPDQDFFAQSMKPKDLPLALSRKAEIIKRDKEQQAHLQQLSAFFAQDGQAAPASSGGGKAEDIVTAAATVLGVGATAVAVATDNSAIYHGVKPSDLVEPLRTEFQSGSTSFGVVGQPDALTATVYLAESGERVPAMTITLTALKEGTEVKVNELTTQGILEAVKAGGEKLLDLAKQGVNLLRRSKTGGISPEDMLSTANQTLESGAGLAETVHNLKLKDRAWKVIKQTAEAIEANYRAQVEKERQARAALERAWDNYNNCPTCGVTFGVEENVCRVCSTARPEKPQKPDPRQP
jgi:rubrerythrin